MKKANVINLRKDAITQRTKNDIMENNILNEIIGERFKVIKEPGQKVIKTKNIVTNRISKATEIKEPPLNTDNLTIPKLSLNAYNEYNELNPEIGGLTEKHININEKQFSTVYSL